MTRETYEDLRNMILEAEDLPALRAALVQLLVELRGFTMRVDAALKARR